MRKVAARRSESALPLATLYVSFCALYATLAWLHPAPWLFGDELKYPELARTIAETGTGTMRGEPQPFENLYTYFLAPAWWIWDTPTAYAVSKYLGVLAMTTALFPAYGLARMLVGKRAALFAAAGTVSIPSLFYSSLLAEETLAYPWATFCLFLFAKALVTRERRWIAGGVAAALVAPAIRGQLAVLPVVFGLAWLAAAWRGERWKAWRAQWSGWDWAGAVLLAIGVLLFFSELMGHLSPTWQLAVGHYKGRMLDYGLRAGGGFAIGIGILPLLAGVALFARRPREEPDPRAHYAFLSLLGACFLAFGYYTAVKAGYLSARFGWPRLLERNLIYLSPLLFVSLAVWLERPRMRLRGVAIAAALVALLVLWTPDQSTYSIYSDAPGLSILSSARQHLGLGPTALEIGLLLLVAASAALLAVQRLTDRRTTVRAAIGCAAVLALAWNLTGELTAASASNKFSRDFEAVMPDPPNWVDLATGGKPAIYLGQGIADENRIFLLEFWNRSVAEIWSVDSSAPGPWREVTPDLQGTHGELIPQPEAEYIVADQGVHPVGDVVERAGTWTLYRIAKPLRLQEGVAGLFPDGWTSRFSAYTQFVSAQGRPGFLTISASREGWKGLTDDATVRVVLGTLGLKEEQPVIRRVTEHRTVQLESGGRVRVVLRTPPPPFRVEVEVTPTFSPEDYGFSDQRELGAQVRFSFTSG